uniref:CCHC-type domain-containing protein n=1 Tax=Amphimedon queenslandica TaxID=400682 RepID=A0A1X7UTQ7_AMPQE
MAASGFFTFGQISESQPELESIETYEQRATMFLLANGIEVDMKVRKDLNQNFQSWQAKPCYCCGKKGHAPQRCRFQEAICRMCGIKGQIQKVRRPKPNIQRKKAPVNTLQDEEG